jgi:hypothetical protein
MQWIIRFTPLFTSSKIKILDLPVGSIVEKTGYVKDNLSEVFFITRLKTYRGWVYTVYLEDLTYDLPQDIVEIEKTTPYPYDFKQYVYVENGSVYYNACGLFCVAQITKLSIEKVFENWKTKSPVAYKNVVLGNKGTGVADLKDIAESCGVSTVLSFPDILRDEFGKLILSPRTLKKHIEDNYIISNCLINNTGIVSPSGIPHWVTLVDIEPYGINNGLVYLYNPAWNAIERYSWREYTASVKIPNGISIPKEQHEQQHLGIL